MMNEKEVIDLLLSREEVITDKIHSAIREIMRHGLEEANRRELIESMIEGIDYTLEDILPLMNRGGKRNGQL